MKTILRNTSIIILSVILSACAAMQIDVDVYKGPLSDEHEVQDEQLMSLAVTSKKLLEDLQRRLMKGIYIKGNNKRTEFRKKGYSSSLAAKDVREIYGRSLGERCTTSFNNNDWVVEKGVSNADEVVVSVSMACNLEELLSLFDDDGNIFAIEYVKNTQNTITNIERLNIERNNLGLCEDVNQDIQSETDNEACNQVNQSIRNEIDTGINDSLYFLKYLKDNPNTLGVKQVELEQELENVIAFLINPKLVQKSPVNDSLGSLINSNFKVKLSYDEASATLAKSLHDSKFLNTFITKTNDLRRKCVDPTFKSTESRFCKSGFARGISALKHEGDHSMAFVKELVQKVINSSKSIARTDLSANRDALGIVSLEREMRTFKENDDSEKVNSLKDRLHRMLLNYAGKLLVLADKQVLLDDKFGKRSASQKYTQVLQSIGTAIVIQINEMKAKNQHHQKSQDWQILDTQLANQFFTLSPSNFKKHVLAELVREKTKLSVSEKVSIEVQKSLKDWLTQKNDLKVVQQQLKDNKLLIKAYQNAIASIEPLQNKVQKDNYIAVSPVELIDSMLAEEEPIRDSSINCANKPLGAEQYLCSNTRDLKTLVKGLEFNTLATYEDFKKAITSLNNHLSKQKDTLSQKVHIVESKLVEFDKEEKNIASQLVKLGNIEGCEELNDVCFTLFGELLKKRTDEVIKYNRSIEHVSKTLIATDQDPNLWPNHLSNSADEDIKPIITRIGNKSLNTWLSGKFVCSEKSETDNSCTVASLDSVIRYLENLVIHLKSVYGKSDELKNTELALTSAYDLRARRQYLTPTSAYLRSSYPASSLQANNSATDWTNMLQRGVVRSLPIVGEWGGANDNHVQQQVDKQFWQNINRVRVTGAGDSNYVVVKDDIGNWYVKNYSSDPDKVYQSLSNMAVASIAKKAGRFISISDGVLSLKNSSNVLDVMYAKFFEQYQSDTKAQFSSHLLWLEGEKWKSTLPSDCSTANFNKIIEHQEAVSDFVELLKQNKKIDDNDTTAQGEAISSLVNKAANYANALAREFKDQKCNDRDEVGDTIKKVIKSDIYEAFVIEEKKKRNKVIEDFEQKILFISEGLPNNQAPTLTPVETDS
jgi:hypothetical protein